ncbi:hypothetical protein [Atlantibacter sp.]|uniref:HVO_A0114 family putative DNA-binding protein n=1 Tax=Atlantibacter sp. TaxID=1903473 RepID=UPI0028AD78E4|nr:hypothetical protein [Atlantibacter sp.]
MAVDDAFSTTIEDAARAMSAEPLEIIRAMKGEQAMSIHELARLVNRDLRGVYNDVQSLLAGGVLKSFFRMTVYASNLTPMMRSHHEIVC